jgi:cytochrome P450
MRACWRLIRVPTSRQRARADIGKFHDYLREHVVKRRHRPRHDLLSDLVAAEVEGKRLDDGEIVGFATLLLLAGHITTTLLLGNFMLCLNEQPALHDTLRGDPSLIPSAVEEALRYRSPVPQTMRITTTDAQIGGQAIGRDQIVLLSLLSANHDERQFDRPNDFLLDRHPNPHLAFGRGIHFCLGAPLARLEARVALGILLQHFSSIRVDPRHPLEPYERFNGTRSLHLLVER